MSLKQAYARLESKTDYLEAEIKYLNKILIKVGFANGISTLKQTVHDLMQEDQMNHHSTSSEEIF